MKTAAAIILMSVVLLLAGASCDSPPVEDNKYFADTNLGHDSIYESYRPIEIDIMPLTELISTDNAASQLRLYVSFLDSSGSRIKSPGVFRFELYRKVMRSAKPKGNRIMIWPDIDLTDIAENGEYWRDFLRAYEFNLDLDPQADSDFILQVTCLCPNGKRLSDEFDLNN